MKFDKEWTTTEARASLGDIIDRVALMGEKHVIARRNRRVVIIPIETYCGMKSLMERAQDKQSCSVD